MGIMATPQACVISHCTGMLLGASSELPGMLVAQVGLEMVAPSHHRYKEVTAVRVWVDVSLQIYPRE